MKYFVLAAAAIAAAFIMPPQAEAGCGCNFGAQGFHANNFGNGRATVTVTRVNRFGGRVTKVRSR